MLKSLTLALSMILSTTLPPDHAGPLQHLVDPNLKCLAVTAFGEARNQGEIGMALVVQSVVNRSEHPDFPETFCDVVEAPRQYAAIHNWPRPRRPHQIEPESWINAAWVTFKVLDGQIDLDESCPGAADITFFFNPEHANPRWAKRFERVCTHGDHLFLASN